MSSSAGSTRGSALFLCTQVALSPSSPESAWLKGSSVAFRGPWGTTYPRNLRATVASLTENEWVARLQAGGAPPMPWYNVSRLPDHDARAIYPCIRTLGEPGPLAPPRPGPGRGAHDPLDRLRSHAPASATTDA